MGQRGRSCAVLVLVSCLLARGAAGIRDPRSEKLIGWKGDTYVPDDKPDQVEAAEEILELVEPEEVAQKPWVQVLSWSPRAFIYHNFLSKSEVRHVLRLASPQMKRSTVVGPNNTGVVDGIRTSAGTFLMRNQDAVITAIEHRLSVWSQLPPENQEDMQVLRYGPSNKYGAHMDGLGRVMSVLIYLIAPEDGGETAFPNSNGWLHPEMGEPSQGPFSDCAKGHVAYKPKMGDALMFYDQLPSYLSMDTASMHTGCPVVKGVKWNAVKWIHGKPFRQEAYDATLKYLDPATPFVPPPDPGTCADFHAECKTWAEAGECTKNPGFMTGGDTQMGSCRLACKACFPCADGDMDCFRKNREMSGYLNPDKDEFQGLL